MSWQLQVVERLNRFPHGRVMAFPHSLFSRHGAGKTSRCCIVLQQCPSRGLSIGQSILARIILVPATAPECDKFSPWEDEGVLVSFS